jgi:hypothetical protein
VRSLHLRLTELSSGPAQLDLFADPATQRRARLEAALDQLRNRYGTVVRQIRNSKFEIRNCNLESRISN